MPGKKLLSVLLKAFWKTDKWFKVIVIENWQTNLQLHNFKKFKLQL